MFFKIAPWLFVLSISLAYAFPSAQNSDDLDPNHVHDDNCTHPIREAFNKVKAGISNAYQKTKDKIGSTFTNIKNSFKKPTEKPAEVTPLPGNENTEASGGDDFSYNANVTPVGNDGSSFGNSDNTGSFPNTGSNPSATSNIGDNSGNQRSPTDSEVEQIINVRFKGQQPKKN